MDTYNKASQAASADITQTFSTSFGLAIRLFPPTMRAHIYNIYGLVRVADEIVDTYKGTDARELLDNLEQETYAAQKRAYSPNVVVHAFALTANAYHIDKQLIEPFFASMRADTVRKTHTKQTYSDYIYGSAEVVGLMCLKVFCDGNETTYKKLLPAARALGAAFQKVNFLRDTAADNGDLQRAYFPHIHVQKMTESNKQDIIADIKKDFAAAQKGIAMLPATVRPAVAVAYRYYLALLKKIEKTPVATLQTTRVRIPNWQKFLLLATTTMRERMRSR